MGGCIDCKHHKSEIDTKTEGFQTKRKCLENHTNELDEWWEANGNKYRKDGFSEMVCFEDHEITLAIEEYNTSLEELLKRLDLDISKENK